jgi:hypothetical protein
MEKKGDTLELKTIIEVDKSMKLVDINGKKLSFQSDCFVKPKNPHDTFRIAIVNQNDLDNGTINFEVYNGGGLFKRRVTYENEDGEHLNHYIAFKKNSTDTSENTISCEVVVRLTELESKPQQFSPIQPQTDQSQPQYVPQSEHQPQPELVKQTQSELEELKSNLEYSNSSSASFYRKVGFFCLFIVILLIFLKK